MKLTRATLYALYALAHIALRGKGGPVAARVMVGGLGITPPFLVNVLRRLVAVRVLRAVMGQGGGYVLARPLSEVTLLEVVEAVEGPLRGEAPLAGEAGATELDARLREVCEDAAAVVRRQLGKVRLSDLIEGG